MSDRKQQAPCAWWRDAVIYQVYPLSFQDSNADGLGDLPGLIGRVDHLSDLGIGAIWLSPVFPSPMRDFGYDIADYTSIDPRFGTIDDFDLLVASLHARGIRLILDVVPNHTSDEHPWFREACSSRDNPKRHWYVWRDPGLDGGPPNNWLSRFGGSAWEWHAPSGQFYYHAFLKEQPDLEWHTPEVRRAFAEVLRFWLNRGVDGFRIDASAVLAEDPLLRDDPPNPDFDDKTPPPERLTRVFTDDRPETMNYLAELREVVDEFPVRVLAGEVQGANGRIGRFYGQDRPRFHLPLNYTLIDTPWDVRSMAAAIDRYLNAIPDGAWPVWVLGGHDKKRIASRIGRQRARVAALLLLTLPGTPFFFAGDEIGMEDVPIASDQARDPFGRLMPGYGLNRDPERAPMRWDSTVNAGFTSGEPWLPIGSGVATCNVAVQSQDPRSMLALYRQLIALRKSLPALTAGEYRACRSQGEVLLFERRLGEQRLLIAANFTRTPQEITWDGPAELCLCTAMNEARRAVDNRLELEGDEGIILELTAG